MSGLQGRNQLSAELERLVRHGWEMPREERSSALQTLANHLFSWQQQRAPLREHCKALEITPGVRFSAYGPQPGGQELPLEDLPALPLADLSEAPPSHDQDIATQVAFARFALRCPPEALRTLASPEHPQTPEPLPILALDESPLGTLVLERWGTSGSPPEMIIGSPGSLSAQLAELPPAKRVMVTTGPGHHAPPELLTRIAEQLKIPAWSVFLSYSVPGLYSAFYDPSYLCEAVVASDAGQRALVPPPWCSWSLVEGHLRIIDCATIDGISFVQTPDAAMTDGRMVFLTQSS